MKGIGIGLFLGFYFCFAYAKCELGIDRVFKQDTGKLLSGKRIGLIINHTSVDSALKPTLEIFQEKAKDYSIKAIFCPEHGIHGGAYANEKIRDGKVEKIPLFSLHGQTRRPTEEMLKDIDILIYDIQDIGSRSYTYATTLYYVMEAAAKKNIHVIVLDRPNPLGGVVDGPMLNEKWRSFIGYINVPYCHGMTIGELAEFFNHEYSIKCHLKVIKMQGWKRSMAFNKTGLTWMPTSPHIPEWDTPFYYATTGLLGELDIVNIGVGYTMPFKVIGAPWIKAHDLAKALNIQKAPGVKFTPFHFRPFYGAFKGQDCQGVMIIITDHLAYRPLTVGYLLIGILKSLYPKEFESEIAKITPGKQDLFCKANGNSKIFDLLKSDERYIAWPLIEFEKKERTEFLKTRQKYLFSEYN